MTVTRLRKGDTVKVVTGADRGKTGEILRVDRLKNRVFVKGLKLTKKRQRPTQANPQGGVIESEGPIHASNVMLLDAAGKAVRIEKARKKAA